MAHTTQRALELEFYFPSAVWSHEATRAFLDALAADVRGATVVGNALGLWEGERERTHLVRVLVRTAELDASATLAKVRESVDGLMRAWSASDATRQEVFLLTTRDVSVHEARSDTHDAPTGEREKP